MAPDRRACSRSRTPTRKSIAPYSPPPPPTVPVMPGDYVTYDDSGLPVLVAYVHGMCRACETVPGNSVAAAAAMFGVDTATQSNPLSHLGLPPALSQKLTAATQVPGLPSHRRRRPQ